MTDGMIGNEAEIVAEIQRNAKARVFSFGIGQSVNRHLLDKMAESGRGEVEYVSLEDDGSKAAKKFYERVRSPLLTDLSIDWNGVPVSDVYPTKLGDLFAAKPVIVNGRYTKAGSGTIKLRGKLAGQDYVREIPISLPETETANDVLATLWARKRIDQLSSEALNADNANEINTQITNLGLEFRLMTAFTSFVAVEEVVKNSNGSPTRVDVPVAIPEGVSQMMTSQEREKATLTPSQESHGSLGQAFVGKSTNAGNLVNPPANVTGLTLQPSNAPGFGMGNGSGTGTGSGNGTGSGSSVRLKGTIAYEFKPGESVTVKL